MPQLGFQMPHCHEAISHLCQTQAHLDELGTFFKLLLCYVKSICSIKLSASRIRDLVLTLTYKVTFSDTQAIASHPKRAF